MDRLSWEKVLPEVSDRFHAGFEEGLKKVMLEGEKKKKGVNRKYGVLLIAAAIMVFGSVTAGAAGLFKWNQRVAERFGVSGEQQDALISKGVTERKEAAVTQNGLTVKLVQTLQDKNILYIAMEVTAPEELKIDSSNLFESVGVRIAGGYKAISDGFAEEKKKGEAANIGFYEWWIHKDSEADLNGTDITVTLKNLQAGSGKLQMYTILEGEWKLNWTLNFKDSTRNFGLDRVCSLSGYDVRVNKVELSPLSMTVYYNGADVRKMEKAEGIDLNHLDVLEPLRLTGVACKDGTSIPVEENGGESGFDQTTGEYMATVMFAKVIPAEDVSGILLGQKQSEIKLLP